MPIIDTDKIIQKGVTAGRDNIGRDNITNKHYYAPKVFHHDGKIKELLAEHEREKENDPVYRKFSDELNKFFSRAMRPMQRDLSQKLLDGGRGYLVQAALESKENVTKKIELYSCYKSAQDIYTYLLTNIRTAFLHEVQSKIKSNKFEVYEIDEIVSSKIIEPFLAAFSGGGFSIDKDELYGLLYFLTGNCYVEWD